MQSFCFQLEVFTWSKFFLDSLTCSCDEPKVVRFCFIKCGDFGIWLTFTVQEASVFVDHLTPVKLFLCLISASHPNLQYIADFAPELGLIIMETKYLEQLGFQVPELARNVALQVCKETAIFESCR